MFSQIQDPSTTVLVYLDSGFLSPSRDGGNGIVYLFVFKSMLFALFLLMFINIVIDRLDIDKKTYKNPDKNPVLPLDLKS